MKIWKTSNGEKLHLKRTKSQRIKRLGYPKSLEGIGVILPSKTEKNIKRNVRSLKTIIVSRGHKQNHKVNFEKIFILYVREYNGRFFEKSLKFEDHGWDEILEVKKFQN